MNATLPIAATRHLNDSQAMKTIFLVDDSATILLSISGILTKAGYAIVGAPEVDLDTAFNTFLANMEGYNVIGLDDVNLALAEDPPPFLLDVREVSELEESGCDASPGRFDRADLGSFWKCRLRNISQ